MNERRIVEALDLMAEVVRDFAVALDHLAAAFDSHPDVTSDAGNAEPPAESMEVRSSPKRIDPVTITDLYIGETTVTGKVGGEHREWPRGTVALMFRPWPEACRTATAMLHNDGMVISTPCCNACEGSGLATHVEWLAAQGMDVGGVCQHCHGTGRFPATPEHEGGEAALDEVETTAAQARGELPPDPDPEEDEETDE